MESVVVGIDAVTAEAAVVSLHLTGLQRPLASLAARKRVQVPPIRFKPNLRNSRGKDSLSTNQRSSRKRRNVHLVDLSLTDVRPVVISMMHQR
jgi:hypothetical protein